MAGVNPRIEIEQGIVDLLTPLKAAKKLKWLEAIGGQDYESMLRAALGSVPFAAVKYTGKVPDQTDGGLVDNSAEISVLIGVKSFKSLSAQRMEIYELLGEIEDALGGVMLGSAAGPGVYFPLVPGPEQWSAISGGQVEVWEQKWMVSWRQDFGRP